jgi:FMN phosphatase YigB (HAD superfamily)
MTTPHGRVFLLDVDNTLLDNDQIVSDLRCRLERQFGAASASRYWDLFEARRCELGYADYLGALQDYRSDSEASRGDGTHLLQMSSFLLDYPFAERLYPRALDVIEHLNTLGTTVILTDGDVVFQPRKVQRSGLWDAVCGRVLIYIHKEQMLDSLQRCYPASHYVMVDDKLRVLAAMKAALRNSVSTVFTRQGHYAMDPANVAAYPGAAIRIEHIGDLLDVDIDALSGPSGPAHVACVQHTASVGGTTQEK